MFTFSYDLPQHKQVEKSIGQPPFEAGQRGRPRGAHKSGLRQKRGFGDAESLQNLHVALIYVHKCGLGWKDPIHMSQVWAPSHACAAT